MNRLSLFYLSALTILLSSCSPDQRCYRNDDCDSDMICNAYGTCQYKCYSDFDCDRGFNCVNHACTIKGIVNPEPEPGPIDDPEPKPIIDRTFVCPENMASIRDTYCIDKYEASRPDATESSQGEENDMAVSKPGVKPWLIGDNNENAEAACNAAGKRLCTPSEWEFACHGINNTVYGYGDQYEPETCNGLDTFQYPGFHLEVTGAFPNCNNGWDVFDMSGNVWEHTAGGSGMTVRGGAYNCNDSKSNHKCSYIPQNWTPMALGFRCCADGEFHEEIIVPDKAPDDDPSEIPQAELTPEFKSFLMGHEILIAQNETDSNTASDARNLYSSECITPEYAIQTAQDFWEYPDFRTDVVDMLKQAKACNAPNDDLNRTLGIAYAKAENNYWALKTLNQIVSQNPNDCESIAWIAWIQIQMAMPEDAEITLNSGAQCSKQSLQYRLDLISAYQNLSLDQKEKAKRYLQKAEKAEELSKSDVNALEKMQNMIGIPTNPNFSWKLELDGGYASNALSGSPNDPTLRGKNLGSPFINGEAKFTLDPWKDAFARAVLEGQFSGQYLSNDDTVDGSYIDLFLRPGVALDWNPVTLGIWYKPEMLIMSGGDKYNDGPLLFYTGHRLELDLEIMKWLYIFGGYGHRTFRQMVRTRDEFDIGAGGHHPLPYNFAMTWGANYRQWLSNGNMYDLYGANLSLALDYRVKKIDFRLTGSFSYDAYPNSKGYFEGNRERNDIAARGILQVWSPQWYGLRLGAQFKASRRWSSANDYDFTDYRGLIAIQWSGNVRFYGPNKTSDNAFSLPWNFETEGSAERIRDIIQQDEDMQRSSSCLQN